MARGAYFDANINPALLRALEETGRGYKKHRVELFSGRAARPKNPSSMHPHGGAVDVNLYDPETNAVLNNFQDPSSAQAYQAYANEVYKWAQQNDPELAQQLRWGGYFGGGQWARDWMHFDVGGADKTQGGNWSEGFDPEYMKTAGLQSSGGLGMGPAMPANTYDYTPEQRRNAIASIESAGSGDYGALGQVISRSGDRAYGRYQVMGSNVGPWTKQVLGTEMTPDQFLASPEAQDKVFDAIFGDYVKKHGEGNAATAWFAGEGNIGKNAKDQLGTSTGDYQSRYLKALGQPGTSTPTPTAAATQQVAGGAAPVAPKAPKNKWQEFGKNMLSGMGGGGSISAPSSGITELPKAVLAPTEPTAIGGGGQEAEMKRQSLAQIMSRLNSGKLF